MDVGGRAPLHDRLAHALRAVIRDGRLAEGDAVPPSRALAEELGCSRWVVTEAYGQLVAEVPPRGAARGGACSAGAPWPGGRSPSIRWALSAGTIRASPPAEPSVAYSGPRQPLRAGTGR
ncbi:winged helix-turn-helix domain-containing protein [Saccharothrix sp. NPDC042600]|uniref:winged helix-turn-helix domain-containing protein n=1 Tax=Saccharothrix TaxID=2071 RepID=UPI0033FD4D26